MTRTDAVAFERAWREAAEFATQHNEARILVEGQCQKLRGELKESERLRSLETQRLAAQIGKMRLDLVNERERIQTLEREFSLAFDAELQRLKQKHESETTKEAIIVVERLKKDLAKVEREKADLMSKLAAVEKTTKITNRKQKIASAYSAGSSSETELQILSGGSGDGIMWSILLWDVIAVVCVVVIVFGILYGAATAAPARIHYPPPEYDYVAPS